ncbi:MAG: glycosyltransferase family 9 protein [Verrucomicrobiales bacterium]
MPLPARERHGGFLFVRGGAMGDFLLTLPALRLARRSFPGQSIEVLGTPGIVALATYFELADAVRRLEDPALARFFVHGASLDPDWCAYFSSFSVVVSYLFDPDGIFHENLKRAGVRTLIRGPHRPAESGERAAEQLAAPLASLALFLEPGEAGQPLVSRDSAAIRNLIALHPGSGSPRKNWGLENWACTADRLHAETGATMIVVAGEAEFSVIDEFCHQLQAAAVPFSLANGLPLRDLARRLAPCRLFLGHDTGPAHLAAACGVPCTLAFGPTDPAVWAPAGSHVHILRAPGGSLAAIGPQEVWAVARAALAPLEPPDQSNRTHGNQ